MRAAADRTAGQALAISGRRPAAEVATGRRGVPRSLARWRPVVPWAGLWLGAVLALGAEQGLDAVSAGVSAVRPFPAIFLGDGEGFVPSSPTADSEWTGDLLIHRAGEYRFFPERGGLWIDGRPAGAAPLRLKAGSHSLRFLGRRGSGPTRLAIEWEGPDFGREPIPPRLLARAGAAPDAPDGRMLFEDLGCSNCHDAASESIQRRPAPVLTGLGGRRLETWIRHWLDDPARFRSWATMPVMLSGPQRADVAAFLAGLPAESISEPRIRNSQVEHGRTMFQSIGCGACHGSDLPMRGLGSKMTPGRVAEYLLDPLRFSPDGRMPTFHLDAAEALALAAFLTASRDESFEERRAGGDAQAGRDLLRESGCLACHSLEGVASDHLAPPLAKLDAASGCLADRVPNRLPRYRLDDREREALQDFIARYRERPDVAAAPAFDLPRRLRQLRCGACHEVDGSPPTGSLAEAAPTLTGIGAKLRAGWIAHALEHETRSLDWQELRMPGFGEAQASWLARAFAQASGVDPRAAGGAEVQGNARAGLERLGADGGRGGMGCIGCHGWGEHASLGENGPNLYEVGRRLREEWFSRWMRDPARIAAGTSMPGYFGAQTPQDRRAVRDLWAAFRSAPALPAPWGFEAGRGEEGSEVRPVPADRAIVIRWDMPEATPAAIAVGLPGGVSFCFDAGESRLRYAWRGGFLDMGRTLYDKKNRGTNLTETAEIVGRVFFREGPYPIRVGDKERLPQRQFRGYRLVGSVPEFHYRVDGIDVYERIEAAQDGLVRRFRVGPSDRPMWFVPTESPGVTVRSTLQGFEIPRGGDADFEVHVVAPQ